MFVNLTRAATFEQDDTDAPFLVNLAHVRTINRTADYGTHIALYDGYSLNVQESLADIMELIIKCGLSTPTILLDIKKPT
jgi:uncharacterized protein YlzI (FlbEa/FlbD family)